MIGEMKAVIRAVVIRLFCLLLPFGIVGAQEPRLDYPLFREITPLALKLTGPFRELSDDDPEERPEHEAIAEVPGPGGTPVAFDVAIRVRGKSRAGYCDFPPLRLDFRRGQVEGTVLEGQDKLKLVTLCKSSNLYRDYLAQEYLIYRLFNELTDRSFRVRWLTVEYVYTDTRRPQSRIEPAFLIESEEEVAERQGLPNVARAHLDESELDAAHNALLSLFQYMIGNTDFAFISAAPGEDECCHNAKVIGSEDSGYIVLPYDFDQAGFINTEYSAPNAILRIQAVTRRLFRGFCRHNPELADALATINARRDALYATLGAGEVEISERALGRSRRFFENSFELLNDPDDFQSEIVEDCRE